MYSRRAKERGRVENQKHGTGESTLLGLSVIDTRKEKVCEYVRIYAHVTGKRRLQGIGDDGYIQFIPIILRMSWRSSMNELI